MARTPKSTPQSKTRGQMFSDDQKADCTWHAAISQEPPEDTDEPSDLDPDPDTDEHARWDVFIADDDERDRAPERGDFWIEPDD